MKNVFSDIFTRLIKNICEDYINSNEEVLYDNPIGTNTSFELSKSIEEFEYIEVYSNLGNSKIYVPTTKTAFMSQFSYIKNENRFYYNSFEVEFINKKAQLKYNTAYYDNSLQREDFNKVYRVVGYKNKSNLKKLV